ncbi:MAG: hypothetical protein ACREBW_08925 [Candidatus Micrarchaeaceae archaeon]
MTVAICWKCGAKKWGAFNTCPKCNATPSSEDDLVTSLAMSDQYFDQNTLERMAADVATGKPPELDSESRLKLIKALRNVGGFKGATKAKDIDYKPPTKPWWKKIF